MAKALRVDFMPPAEKARALTDGSIRIPAFIARTGVQVYTYADGTTVREYRPPEEVFANDSLASWPGLALTDDHPSDAVTADNWRSLAVGHVGDNARKDGIFVAVDCILKDSATIAKVANGELVEISCGYYCDVERTPGETPDGEPYDAIQRGIVGNHVAIGPAGWGRAGERVKLYASDSNRSERMAVHYPNNERETEDMKTDANGNPIKTDNAPATVAADVHSAVLAERDMLRAQIADKPKTDSATIARAVAASVVVYLAALKVDSKIKLFDDKGALVMTERDAMLAVIRKVNPKFSADGKDDTYVRVAFDFACAQEPKTDADEEREDTAERPNANALAGGVDASTKVDAKTARDDGNSAVDARTAMIERNRNAWKGTGK